MLNCQSCVFADFDSGKCKRLLIRLPHICPYSEERKPRNHFEEIKNMSMEEMAELLFRKFQDIYEAVTKDGAYFGKRDMMRWLMEAVDHES